MRSHTVRRYLKNSALRQKRDSTRDFFHFCKNSFDLEIFAKLGKKLSKIINTAT